MCICPCSYISFFFFYMDAGVVSRLRGWESASHLSNSCNKQRHTQKKKKTTKGGKKKRGPEEAHPEKRGRESAKGEAVQRNALSMIYL